MFSIQNFFKNMFTWQPLPFKLSRRGTILEINALFGSVLLLFGTSTIFIAIVSGSWLNLRLFVPSWMIKLSVLRFSGGCLSSYLLLLIRWMLHYNFFVIIRSFPSIYIFENRITHYSYNDLAFFALLFLFVMSEVCFFLSWDTGVIWFIAFVWVTLSIVIFYWYDIVSIKPVFGVFT